MEFDVSFWVQMIVYAVTFAFTFGTMSQQIKQLTKSVEKHNSIVERTFKVEASTASAHKRLDEMRAEIDALQAKK